MHVSLATACSFTQIIPQDGTETLISHLEVFRRAPRWLLKV